MVFLVGVSHGIVARLAALLAQADVPAAARLLGHGVLLNVMLAAMLCLLAWGAVPWMYHLKQDAEVTRLALPYYRIIVLSLLPTAVFLALSRYLEASGRTGMIFFISVSLAV